MIRASLARVAVRAYPVEIREIRGDELVGTLLDAGEHSVIEFACQLVSVVLSGLLTRARRALGQPLSQMGSDVVRWAAIMIVARVLSGVAIQLLRSSIAASPMFVCVDDVLPLLTIWTFTVGRDRAAGVFGLLWVVADVLSTHDRTASLWIEMWVTPLIGFALMTVAPRANAPANRVLWLIPTLAWATVWVAGLGPHSGLLWLAPSLAALIFLLVAPTFALGTTLAWALMAATMVGTQFSGAGRWGSELLVSVPAVLILSLVSRRAVRLT